MLHVRHLSDDLLISHLLVIRGSHISLDLGSVSHRKRSIREPSNLRQMLMMSFPSPTSCARAVSPFASIAFFSATISSERRAMLSEIRIRSLNFFCGCVEKKAWIARSGSTRESQSMPLLIKRAREREGLVDEKVKKVGHKTCWKSKGLTRTALEIRRSRP